MALPALALGIPVSASLIRVVRTSMVEELDRDYVRTAIGNGVPYREVVSKNVLRNALVTPVTVLGLRVGYLLGGAVVIEMIFALPGMGQLILNGITNLRRQPGPGRGAHHLRHLRSGEHRGRPPLPAHQPPNQDGIAHAQQAR